MNQGGVKPTCVKHCTGAKYKDMLNVLHQVLACYFQGHAHYIKYIKSVTNVVYIPGYDFHTDTELNYPPHMPRGLSSNIQIFLHYHTINQIHSVLLYTERIGKIGSANNSNTEISEATDTNLIKIGNIHSTRVTILHECQDESCTYVLTSQGIVLYCIWVIKIPPSFIQREINAECFLGGYSVSDRLLWTVIPSINRAIRQHTLQATPSFEECICILKFVDILKVNILIIQLVRDAS